MKTERDEPEPTIIELLNDEMKKGSNNPDEFPTVQLIAERMGIDNFILRHWLENDKQFKEGLQTVKRTYNNDPCSSPTMSIKLIFLFPTQAFRDCDEIT